MGRVPGPDTQTLRPEKEHASYTLLLLFSNALDGCRDLQDRSSFKTTCSEFPPGPGFPPLTRWQHLTAALWVSRLCSPGPAPWPLL